MKMTNEQFEIYHLRKQIETQKEIINKMNIIKLRDTVFICVIGGLSTIFLVLKLISIIN